MDAQEEIKKMAYELYEQRGRIDGDDPADWLEAERSVMKKSQEQAERELKPRVRKTKSSTRRKS